MWRSSIYTHVPICMNTTTPVLNLPGFLALQKNRPERQIHNLNTRLPWISSVGREPCFWSAAPNFQKYNHHKQLHNVSVDRGKLFRGKLTDRTNITSRAIKPLGTTHQAIRIPI